MTQSLICGVDEAGRGPLAGPVCAAAVILDPNHPILGLKDSKKLSASRRDTLAMQIRDNALAWSIAWASASEIDTINILQATLLAMRRAVEGLKITPELALIDGNQSPKLSIPQRTIVKGDALEPCISAASILAKTARDALMTDLARQYPPYGFEKHAGYPVPMHLAALSMHGPCPEHRRSFAPVKAVLESAKSAK